MNQLIVKTMQDADMPAMLVIGPRFYVRLDPYETGLEITIEKEEGCSESLQIELEPDECAVVDELVYESWDTGFDELFSKQILTDICEYMQNDRYWNDCEIEYRPYFDMDVYEKLWHKRLLAHIKSYQEGCYPIKHFD